MNAKFLSLSVCAFALASALAASSLAEARGNVSFDFLFNMGSVQDDSQYFLNLTVSNSGYQREMVEPVLHSLRVVEVDLPVLIFLAQHSGRPLNEIAAYRAAGETWFVIFPRCHVPYDVLFTGIDRDPGPPYGRAWGHWHRHHRRVRFSDDEIAGLVQIQLAHQFTHVRPFELARERGRGRTMYTVVADRKEWRRNAESPGKHPKNDHQHGKGRGK